MTKKKTPKLTPREAIKLARSLGWEVEPKRKSGDIVFHTPGGERFTARAPGRADRVPLVLARALSDAADQTAERDGKDESTK